MTVSAQTPYNNYIGNAATTAFSYTFLVLLASDLVVKVSGVTLVNGVGYTVSGIGSSAGGTVTMTSAPASLAPITIYRSTAITRAVDYQSNGDFLSPTVNADFDRLWLVLQELFSGPSGFGRMVKAPIGETIGDLPSAAARAGNLLSFDSSGNPIAVAAAAGTATQLTIDLASSTLSTKNAGQVGYNDSLAYSAATVGAALRLRAPVVDSIAGLRALLKTGTPRAFVYGYYAAGDGGGGQYWYDSTDTTTADNGGSVIVASDGGRWKLVTQGWMTTKQFGAKHDDSTSDTATILAAATAALAANCQLVISPGTAKIGSLILPSGLKVLFYGKLHMIAAATLDVRALILNPMDDWLFTFDDVPTNDSASPVPVKFTDDWHTGPTRKTNGKISVKWFGAQGDWDKTSSTGTDDTNAINCATTSLAFSGSGGFNANSKAGASTLYSPRGLYKLTGTVRVSSGVILEGEYGGSTGLSNWYRKDGATNSMVILQSYGIGGVGATFGSQHIVRNMGFQFISTFASGDLTQQNTATIEFRDAIGNTDTIFENCWLLDSPMSGAHFLVGNKNINGDVTGLTVVLRLQNANMDVNRGAHFKVQGNGVLNVFMASGVMYQSTYGAVKSTSASSTQSRFDFHDVDVLLQGKVTDNDAGSIVNVIGGNVAQIYTDCRITGGSADGFAWGGGFTPAGGYLLVQGCDIYATGCRLLAGAAGSTTEVRFKGTKLDYSAITGALTSGPNKLMHLKNAAVFEFSDCSVKSGTGTGFLYCEPGFGDVAKLFVMNNRTDLAAGTMDVTQTTSQIEITGNIYAATANVKTVP